MSYAINGGMWNSQPWNGPAFLLTIASQMKVLYNQTTIDLDWAGVSGANYYQVQVSLYPDFRTCFVDVSHDESDYSFTDSQTNDLKRYWRWRPSRAAGSDWIEPWSEPGSYWLDTGADDEIDVPRHYWVLVDPDDTTDLYWFDLPPVYQIIPHNLNRFQDRNRLGDLLSEFLTVKADIQLMFTGSQFIAHAQLNEFRRFHSTKRTFFLATFKIGERDRPMPNIWKVEFVQDPTFAMIAPGRPDLLRGNAVLTEV